MHEAEYKTLDAEIAGMRKQWMALKQSIERMNVWNPIYTPHTVSDFYLPRWNDNRQRNRDSRRTSAMQNKKWPV